MPTRIAVYQVPHHMHGGPRFEFMALREGAGIPRSLPPRYIDGSGMATLLATIPLKGRYEAAVRRAYRRTPGPSPIGFIQYTIDGATAASSNYNPKIELGARAATHLGRELEGICVRRLMRLGTTHVMAPGTSSEDRKAQLERCGLQAGVKYPVGVWLERITRGL